MSDVASPTDAAKFLATPSALQKIEHFVVLMLENRSFDHLIGFRQAQDARVAGLSGNESNVANPNEPNSPAVAVSHSAGFAMPFDPGHEFADIQIQLYGPQAGTADTPNPPSPSAPMNGFVYSANRAEGGKADGARVMQCFQPDELPVISKLIDEFALFNFWYSSLPGPTWPNRFFVHAATSGGLKDSPTEMDILKGYAFKNGTLYDRLQQAGREWRIYHDDLPQAAGIDSLRLEYVNPFTRRFREMKFFADDVAAGTLPDYVFIEPRYDTGHEFAGGNSMHPQNDLREGEKLIKHVYEALRNSAYWNKTLLLVTFDEHGGFYDHVAPPAAVPSGDDTRYAKAGETFAFDRLGVRVPAIAVSAYTRKGTVIGDKTQAAPLHFDHSSILATLAKRFRLSALTQRDQAANTLEFALNLASPRQSSTEAPVTLPAPVADNAFTRMMRHVRRRLASSPAGAPLSISLKTHLALALACHLRASPDQHDRLVAQQRKIRTRQEAADYIQQVTQAIHSRRRH